MSLILKDQKIDSKEKTTRMQKLAHIIEMNKQLEEKINSGKDKDEGDKEDYNDS
jgi:hypothetical protein